MTTPAPEQNLTAWNNDVPLRGSDAPKDDGHIEYLIQYLLTVHRRFGNTAITCDLQWGAPALRKRDEYRQRVVELEDELAALRASSQEWLPTADNINALPEPIRKYIADLATRCDPAGDIAALTFAQDQVRQLSASNYQLRNALRTSSQRNPNTAVVGDPKAWNGDEVVRVELAGERGNKAGTAQAGLVAPSSGSLPNTAGTVTPATPSAVWDMTAPGTPSEDMPAEVFEWFQHLELHLTEHDEAHAGRALRSAWPAVRDYFLTCLGAAGKPKRRADGCRHTVQRMMEWIDDGACPICAVAAAGMRRDKLHQTALVLQEVLNYGEQGLMIDEHLRNRIEQCLPAIAPYSAALRHI